jgi:hypothetical protein
VLLPHGTLVAAMTRDSERKKRILELARRVYGEGECSLLVTGDDATITRDNQHLCHVAAFDGDILGALERYLCRRLDGDER